MLAVFTFLAGCGGYRPARFADKAAVTDVGDDAAIPLPRRRVVHEPIWLADVYLRRPLMDALEAERVPDAGDVNSLDEVPRSSWFQPPSVLNATTMARRPGSASPPKPPLTVLAEPPRAGRSGFSVVDARGQIYELRVDPADRPGMKTAAEAIASRLAWAFGYRTPEVFVTRVGLQDFVTDERSKRGDGTLVDFEALLRTGPPPVGNRYRVSATAWPAGIDVGPSPIATTRDDDPNDLVPHRDRRTLRALQVFGAFVKLRRIGPHSIADLYVGPHGQGHLEHYLVGLDAALGAADVVRPGDPEPEIPALSPLVSLVTLGLARAPKRVPTQTEMPAVGEFSPDLSPSHFAPPDPYEPIERILPTDGYWAAKRLASISRRLIVAAVRAAELDDPVAGAYLVDTLDARRQALMAHWYAQVSPLEVAGTRGGDLLIADRAIIDGVAKVQGSAYTIRFFDEEGSEVGKAQRWQASGKRFRLPLSAELRKLPYLVVRIVARRDGKASPRAFEVHWMQTEGKGRVVGVRH